jgi:transcriptional regulator with XRE-family HTH domain
MDEQPPAEPQPLRARLAELRGHAGFSGRKLAERLGWDAPMVSKVENSRRGITADETRRWAVECGASPDLVGELALPVSRGGSL